MKVIHEVEVDLTRYLLYSKTKVLAQLTSSDMPGANLRKVLCSLAHQKKRFDLDLHASQALFLYTEGVKNGEPLAVILARIEAQRITLFRFVGTASLYRGQPFVEPVVYRKEYQSKIRMLLKNICARHLRIFLLSYRKGILKATPKSPPYEAFPPDKEKGGRIAPAA